MWQLRYGGHHPIVIVDTDDRRLGADSAEQIVHAFQHHAARDLGRRQVPSRFIEEILAGVDDARVSAASKRVTTDKALVARSGIYDLPLN